MGFFFFSVFFGSLCTCFAFLLYHFYHFKFIFISWCFCFLLHYALTHTQDPVAQIFFWRLRFLVGFMGWTWHVFSIKPNRTNTLTCSTCDKLRSSLLFNVFVLPFFRLQIHDSVVVLGFSQCFLIPMQSGGAKVIRNRRINSKKSRSKCDMGKKQHN